MTALINKLQKIKTMANNANVKITPHKACVSVASLELEKQRHTQELVSLLRRVNELNARLKKINEDQKKLSKVFLDVDSTNEPDLLKKYGKKSGPDNSSGGFKIRY